MDKELEKRLAHIESLLQCMPEMIASAIIIEKERSNDAFFLGKRYSETVELERPNLR